MVDAVTLDDDPYSEEVGCNPYPYYDRIREAGPVVFLSRHRVYVSARDPIARDVLTDWRRFSSAWGIGPLKAKAVNELKMGTTKKPASGLLEYDPPEHGPARRVLMSLLTHRALETLRLSFEAAAESLVEELLQRESVDLVSDVVQRFVLSVMGDAVGLPKEGRHHLLVFGELAMNVPGPHNDRYQRALARVEQEGTRDWIARMTARNSLSPAGFGAQLYAKADAGEISSEEAGALVGVFLAASVDSTVMTLVNGLKAFATSPAQWYLLRQRPGAARFAFEEMLRFCPAPQNLFRTTTSEVELGGIKLPAGEKVGVSLAGANRDASRWSNPNEFDIERRPSGHLAFGAGVHACLGQMVARLEAECLLAALARRVQRIDLAGEPVRFANNAMSSYSALPARLIAA